ncbi:MAG: hypothetical protein IKZ53_01805 [Selenomonadaceae bacterium]|nr:hypothetical protein [Selenomonadaceae bacterium]
MKKLLNLCLAVLLMAFVFSPAKTFAEESEGIAAFREALTSDSDAADRIFRQDILFVSPLIQSELDLLGMADGDTFKSTGEFSIWIYADDGSVTEQIIPYYMIQNNKDMNIYFKTNKQWEKLTAPSLAAVVTDFIATPSPEEIEEIIADTKSVDILQENDYRRIMMVRVNGERIADSIKAKAEENPADNATADVSAIQDMFVNYLDAAFRNADIWYLWTIDKRDWHTVAMQFNLSGIIQELARAALNDPNQQWPDDMSNLLETVAYYSEIRAYTTYPADPAAKKKFDIPKNVLKAKPVK